MRSLNYPSQTVNNEPNFPVNVPSLEPAYNLGFLKAIIRLVLAVKLLYKSALAIIVTLDRPLFEIAFIRSIRFGLKRFKIEKSSSVLQRFSNQLQFV